MKHATFQHYKLGITVALGAIVAVSVTTGSWYLPAIAIVSAASILFALKRHVRDVTEDERDRKIGGQAALMAMTIHSIVVSVVGATLISLDANDALLYWAGSAMLYSTCGFVLLYSLLFKWYARKQDQD